MSSSSSPSHDHEPKINDVYHRSNPSFRFLDYSNPIQNELKNPSSTTNDSGKQNNVKKKKIIWFFSYSVPGNHNDVEKQNKHTYSYSCDVCNKVFTSNKAFNGHKICHTQKGFVHPQTAAPSSFEQSHIDCSKYLPPISYNTKKRKPCRRRRYTNIDDDLIAAETLLHISRGGYEGSSANINVNHHGTKRQKLSCHMIDDDEKKQKEQGVLLTSGDIDGTLKDNSHNEKNLVLRFKIPKGKIFQTSQHKIARNLLPLIMVLKRRRLMKMLLN